MRPFLFGSILVACIAGCTSSSTSPESNESDFTSTPQPASPDVPLFTEADTFNRFEGRMRVSVDGAAFKDEDGQTSRSLDEGIRAYAVSGLTSGFRADFGVAGKQPERGTYSCADNDGLVAQLDLADSKFRRAVTCTIVIDEVKAGPSKDYARVYGHFEAARAEDAPLKPGLKTAVKGAFVGDVPLYRSLAETE